MECVSQRFVLGEYWLFRLPLYVETFCCMYFCVSLCVCNYEFGFCCRVLSFLSVS